MDTRIQTELAQLLAHQESPVRDSASVLVPSTLLDLRVDGVGTVSMPVRAERVPELIAAARPARFGRGEETLLDESVRNTWEIIPAQVTLGGADWEAALAAALEVLGTQLGIVGAERLRAELHAMLIYGEGQFFAPHQDSEKHEDMLATLVVSLPSTYTGGELLVDDQGRLQPYAGSRTDLELVAFYSDRRHEVLPVGSGTRITLTFNLLLDSGATDAPTGPVDRVAALLRHHFNAPDSGSPDDPPTHLAILLDHEYSENTMRRGRLKGVDAERAALIRAAADVAGLEHIFALAQVEEIRDAAGDHDDFYDDEDHGYEEDSAVTGSRGHTGHAWDDPELLDGFTELTWWSDSLLPGAISLPLAADDMCVVTPSRFLKPYDSQYEGYMGNYGNTVENWYRRAALVLWPTGQGFAVRALANPGWALDVALASVRSGDLERARTEVRVLTRGWGRSAPEDSMNTALELAAGVQDRAMALALVTPYRLEMLSPDSARPLAALWQDLPKAVRSRLREVWESPHHVARAHRAEWIGTVLRPLAQGLREQGVSAAAHWLASWAWAWLEGTISDVVGQRNAQVREEQLTALGSAVAATMDVAEAATSWAIGESLLALGEAGLPLLVSVLRHSDNPASPSAQRLARGARSRLSEVLARAPRQPGDWSIPWISPGGDDADRLAQFLNSSREQELEWPLAAPRRGTIHHLIEAHGLPLTHVTRRQGRPFTLVLRKTDALFKRGVAARDRAQQNLAWLDAAWQDPSGQDGAGVSGDRGHGHGHGYHR